MSEHFQGLDNAGLIEGLSHEPMIVGVAEWMINGKPLKDLVRDYDTDYRELLEYIETRYGIGQVIVDAALKRAESRTAEEIKR